MKDATLSNHQLSEALKKAQEELEVAKASEEITREGRAALAELHSLLGGLGVYSSQPPPAAPDAKTCLHCCAKVSAPPLPD